MGTTETFAFISCIVCFLVVFIFCEKLKNLDGSIPAILLFVSTISLLCFLKCCHDRKVNEYYSEIESQIVVMKTGEKYRLVEKISYRATTVKVYKNGRKILVPVADIKYIYVDAGK